MFTGIIEAQGTLVGKREEGTNVHLDVKAPFTAELNVDQSVAHDGVCLTVVAIEGDVYTVTAIEETLAKTHLGGCDVGHVFNLERCAVVGDRIDGHVVQRRRDSRELGSMVGGHSWGGFVGTSPGRRSGPSGGRGSASVNGVGRQSQLPTSGPH